MHYLPTPFPDEHIASLIARSAENQGRSPYLLSGLAAGKYQRYAPPRFVTSAAALSRDLTGSEYDKKALIRRFCIYPFFAPFLGTQARIRHLRWALRYDSRGSSLSRAGGRPRSPVTLRLCPACAQKEKDGRAKQPYYHREHQLPGLDFCLRHHLQLREVGSHFNHIHLHSARIVVDQTDSDALSEAEVSLPPSLITFLNESIEFLFSRDCFRNGRPDWRSVYSECLSATNTHALKDNIDALMDKIEPDANAMLPKASGPQGWLRAYSKRFLRINGTNLPPIAHILIIYGLGLSIKDAAKYATEGLWRCPIKLCSSFGQLSVTKIVRRHSLHVKCSGCGCTFTIPRSTPLGTIPPLVSVLTFAPQISERLLMMRTAGATLEVIAKNTGLTAGKVYSFLQDLEMAPKTALRKSQARLRQDRLKAARASLLAFIASSPMANRNRLYKIPGYQFLQAHDREWLKRVLPPLKMPEYVPPSQVEGPILKALRAAGRKGLSIQQIADISNLEPTKVSEWIRREVQVRTRIKRLRRGWYALSREN